jgi:2'-5' RNA ligase
VLRLFIALDLPHDVKDTLATLAAQADQDTWRPVKPEALHLTLAFLGSRPETDVSLIEPIITAETEAPHLALRRILLLPPRRARVLTVELEETGLRDLQARVSDRLEQAGVYTPEKRPFRPHVTIARLRPRVDPPKTASLDLEPLSFDGTAVTLYVSRLHPHGARYEALASARLATP